MKRIAIFASGSGTNAENIIKYFQANKSAEVVLVLSNNPEAFVLKRASELNVKTIIFDKNQLNDSDWALENLSNLELDLVVLAGFLWKFPPHLLNMFQNKVLNIHPSLLPKYGVAASWDPLITVWMPSMTVRVSTARCQIGASPSEFEAALIPTAATANPAAARTPMSAAGSPALDRTVRNPPRAASQATPIMQRTTATQPSGASGSPSATADTIATSTISVLA